MACIILGVTGSIAAYKAADIASALVKYGHGDQRELGRDERREVLLARADAVQNVA